MKKFTFVLGFLLVSLAGMAQKNVVNVEVAGTLQRCFGSGIMRILNIRSQRTR